MRRYCYASAMILVVIAPFLMAEGAVRLFFEPVDSIALFVTPFEQKHNKRTGSVFEGDPAVGWRLKQNVDEVWWDYTLVSTNKGGQRAEGEWGPKKKGTYRIVALGDSVTFGYRAPIVFSDRIGPNERVQQDYPTQLARLLRSEGRVAEAFPFAVPGYTSRQGRLWLEDIVDDLDADLVTILYGWNDGDLRPVPDRVTFDGDRWKTMGRRMVAASQGLSHLSQWWRGRRGEQEPPPYGEWVPRSSPEEYVENIVAMARLVRSTGARVVVIAPVYRDAATDPAQAKRMGAFRDALGEACAKEGIDYLLVPELTEAGSPANARYFDIEPIHPNVAGHRLLADRLVERIVNEEHGK